MGLRRVVMAAIAALALLSAPASARTFRFAAQGDFKSLDPYTLNETFTLAMHGAVYEGLTKRGPNLEILPGLAERWEIAEPTRCAARSLR